ncbi:MAG: pyridoxal-phosphate-dependent aminotransferase family protein [Dehalococcoidia bacterium]
MRQNLRTPGPTPVPEESAQAATKPMINHRGPEAKELLFRLTDRLKQLFQTQNDLFILTASGTGALEAAIVNTLSPGDRVLAVTTGVFGDRFTSIAQAYGAQVSKQRVPWGSAADPEAVRQALKEDPSIKAVLITHNETSTGVTNDLEVVAGVVKGEFDKLLLVDAVSAVGSIPLATDAWQCDVVTGCSQKGWMTPPGLAMASVSPRAWEAYREATMPRFYFDLGVAKRYLQEGQTPWTPALSVLYSLDASLERLLQEGVEQTFQRHAEVGQLTREGVKALGLELFPEDERYASNTVTAIKAPPGVDVGKLLELLRTEHSVVLAAGQSRLKGQIFRIGHLGLVSREDILNVLRALELTLPKVGFTPAGTIAR